jgi:hypothetical protein
MRVKTKIKHTAEGYKNRPFRETLPINFHQVLKKYEITMG